MHDQYVLGLYFFLIQIEFQYHFYFTNKLCNFWTPSILALILTIHHIIKHNQIDNFITFVHEKTDGMYMYFVVGLGFRATILHQEQ